VDRYVSRRITFVYDFALSSNVNHFLLHSGLPQIKLVHETEICNADPIIYNTKEVIESVLREEQVSLLFLKNVLLRVKLR